LSWFTMLTSFDDLRISGFGVVKLCWWIVAGKRKGGEVSGNRPLGPYEKDVPKKGKFEFR